MKKCFIAHAEETKLSSIKNTIFNLLHRFRLHRHSLSIDASPHIDTVDCTAARRQVDKINVSINQRKYSQIT